MTALDSLRVAIVGAGPAGIYAGNLLSAAVAERGGSVQIDLLDSLPAPYGLIRYGVSPDHPRIKGIITSLHEMLDAGTIRFTGNVLVGRDVSVDELRTAYDAVIMATGALWDAPLSIPGIDLKRSYGAADFVAWYDGHPDVAREWPLDVETVAVIGNGNVALDVARVLAKQAEDMRSTEVADNVLEGLEASKVTDVHLFGRRGPEGIKFTPIELRELGEVENLDIILDEEDFAHIDSVVPANNQMKIMLRTINSWRNRELTGAKRRMHLHFFHAPLEIVGDGEVEAMRFARTTPNEDGTVTVTDEIREIPVQAVYRAIGYKGSEIPGVPYDDARGVIPNEGGRVTGEAGLYATGWIKRGPIGLIGHTKSDAMETVSLLVEDAEAGKLDRTDAGDIRDLLAERGVEFTTWEGWHQLDAHEIHLGETHKYPRERVKVVSREEQVALSRDGSLSIS